VASSWFFPSRNYKDDARSNKHKIMYIHSCTLKCKYVYMPLSWELILNIAHWVVLNCSCHRTKVNSQFPNRKKKILSYNTHHETCTYGAINKPTNSHLAVTIVVFFFLYLKFKTPPCTLSCIITVKFAGYKGEYDWIIHEFYSSVCNTTVT